VKSRWLVGVAGIALLLLLLPRAEVAVPVEHYHLAMGTVVRLALYVETGSGDEFVDLATAQIDRVDSLMSDYSPHSEVSQLSHSSGGDGMVCSAEVMDVLRRSQHFARQTSGAFDATLGALTRLWGFPEAEKPPPSARVDSALQHVGYAHLRLDGERVYTQNAGLQLDLGAAAKGYAVDRAVEALTEAGLAAGLIEAGGDIRFWGRKPDGRPWRFGVRHPRDPDQTITVDDVGLSSLATSGDYEQFFEHEGQRYHHLLDPFTGYPARAAVSATAWAATAMDADILATAFFVMGPDAAVTLAESLPGVETLVFYEADDGLEYAASSGLRGHVTIAPR